MVTVVPMELRDHLIEVIGTKEMTINEVVSGLRARGWMPESPDPLNYIGLALNAYDDFEAVDGKYKVNN